MVGLSSGTGLNPSWVSEQINEFLNVEQQEAINAVLDRVHGPGPYIIFGPPGTGKTVTVILCSNQ